MNLENIINFTDDTCRTVHVAFSSSSSKTYTYLTDLTLEKGDWVVVDTDRGLQVVSVIKLDDDCDIDIQDPIKYKWVVCKVDLTEYAARIKDINAKVRELRKQQRKAIARQTLESLNLTLKS